MPALTSLFDPSNWVYDDDINRLSDEEQPQAYGGDVGSSGVGDVSGGGVGSVRISDAPSSSGAMPLEEEMYTPLTTRRRTLWVSRQPTFTMEHPQLIIT